MKSQAIALSRPQAAPLWPWLALAAALAAAGAAHAATPKSADSDNPVPTEVMPRKGAAAGPVLKPKVNPDPEINVPTPPKAKFPMPVIKPPSAHPEAGSNAAPAVPAQPGSK